MSKPMKKMIIYVLILFGVIFGIKFIHVMLRKYNEYERIKNNVVYVSAMPAKKALWQASVTAVGSSRTVEGVNVTAELGGMITLINFTPGKFVHQGDLLVQQDISTNIAQLHALQAQAAFAKITYERNLKQYQVGAVSQETLAGDESQFKATAANVAEQEATIAQKTIRAPFSGQLGISLVNLGQYINPGDPIVNLQTLSPIWIDFFLPQQQLHDVSLGKRVLVTVDTYPNQKFYGNITTINPMVDEDVRNVKVEATLANKDGKILPGMFVNITLNQGKAKSYVTLPQTAISFNPYGDVVFTLKKTSRILKNQTVWEAKANIVTTGASHGTDILVLKGVNPGDMIVTAGQLKLTNGSMVIINNNLAEAKPKSSAKG